MRGYTTGTLPYYELHFQSNGRDSLFNGLSEAFIHTSLQNCPPFAAFLGGNRVGALSR